MSKKQHEEVLNISQDIIAAISSTPTPKQIGIALHIVKQTRSKDTVTLLNRFGHCISYYDAQRYISSMALRAEDQLLSNGCFIPQTIKSELFTHFAFDNFDFHESNLDGKTTHGTTHIIYQYQDPAAMNTPYLSFTIPLKKGRRVAIEASEPFHPDSSMLTLSDQQKSRSLCGMKLVPDERLEIGVISRNNFLFKLCSAGSAAC